MPKVPYTKPSLRVDQQIDLLKNRGVSINNREKAERFLTYHNYYYVSGYVYYFEIKGQVRTHKLSKPVSFDDIITLVLFDQELRELCFNAVQSIEIAVRSSIARNLSLIHGAFCLEKAELFKNGTEHAALMDKINQSLSEHNREAFITHYSNKYTEHIPPVWVVIEILTFGAISRLYSNLKNELQIHIAADFGIDHHILVSWLKAITELRNTCAHHSRLWNKVFVNYPKIIKKDRSFPVMQNRVSRLGSFIPLINHMLNVISEKQDWQMNCLSLLKNNTFIRPADLGLSQWW